jgi:hypothetical protein
VNAANLQRQVVGKAGQIFQVGWTDRGGLSQRVVGRVQDDLVVITENRVNASVPQKLKDLVREAVLVDDVACAENVVAVLEEGERPLERIKMAVDIGKQSKLQWLVEVLATIFDAALLKRQDLGVTL